MTDLEAAIAEATRRMEDHLKYGELTLARKWAARLRELISERETYSKTNNHKDY